MSEPSWMYVKIYAFCYRTLMRTTHRFGWHYAPDHGPMPDGRYIRWCHWCGMRDSYLKPGTLAYETMVKGILSAQTPSLIPRCQERHPESGQCELRLGHDKIHLAGEYCWPVTTAEEKR